MPEISRQQVQKLTPHTKKSFSKNVGNIINAWYFTIFKRNDHKMHLIAVPWWVAFRNQQCASSASRPTTHIVVVTIESYWIQSVHHWIQSVHHDAQCRNVRINKSHSKKGQFEKSICVFHFYQRWPPAHNPIQLLSHYKSIRNLVLSRETSVTMDYILGACTP